MGVIGDRLGFPAMARRLDGCEDRWAVIGERLDWTAERVDTIEQSLALVAE